MIYDLVNKQIRAKILSFNPEYDSVLFHLDDVHQFSYSASRVFLGGSSSEEVLGNFEMAAVNFFDCVNELSETVSCHPDCLTCFGPYSNNCLECDTSLRMTLNIRTNRCECRFGTVYDTFYKSCEGDDDFISEFTATEKGYE